MSQNSSLPGLPGFASRLRRFMAQELAPKEPASRPPTSRGFEFDLLARELFTLQFTHNTAYRKLCEFRIVSPANVSQWQEIPAISTTAFKELDLTSLAPGERTLVFRSSGTTESRPSRHFHSRESLEVYKSSLLPWFRAHLDSAGSPTPFLCLTPAPTAVPHSSLAHMFGAVIEFDGGEHSDFVGVCGPAGAWELNFERAIHLLADAESRRQPLILLGTAFNYLHLIDHLHSRGRGFQLARGSRALETGGYKGRSRAIPKSELHSLISEQLGIPPSQIVCEYGMSELTSQAYDRSLLRHPTANSNDERTFNFPPWARARIVSPENGREVADGETGLIQVFDLANIWSVMAIQTEDLGVRRGTGFELLGRARDTASRGCSLMSG